MRLLSFSALFLLSVATIQAQYHVTQTTPTSNSILLQHHFIPGQAAKTNTQIRMNGDSLIGEQNAKTNLTIQMNRLFSIQNVNQNGQASMNVQVQELQTNGSMGGENFNESMTGNRMKQVMMGASEMDVRVNPWGQVNGSSPSALQNMGISIPGGLDQGGFEFPAFPRGPVKVGSSWDQNGILMQRNEIRESLQQGGQVYRLKQIRNTKNGRMAIIEYNKTSDLSGLGLGETSELRQAMNQLNQAGQLQGQALPDGFAKGFTVPELKIQLSGEIHFNVDYGLVSESHQKGTWTMQSDFPIYSGNQKTTRVKQKEMDLEIRTQFIWNSGEKIEQSKMHVHPSIPKIQLPVPTPTPRIIIDIADEPIEVQ